MFYYLKWIDFSKFLYYTSIKESPAFLANKTDFEALYEGFNFNDDDYERFVADYNVFR